MQCKIGCDPELFVRNKETGQIISAHNLVPGSKKEPFKVFNGAVQPDGVAAEFNIDPSISPNDFTFKVFSTINKLNEIITKDGTLPYELIAVPVANFDSKYFRRSLPSHVKTLGCDPDFDAYTGTPNEIITPREAFRTGSGHLHIGWGSGFLKENAGKHFEDVRGMVRQLDVALFIPSLLWDSDTKRRTLYGKIGAFRPKDYGFEYRPLSNAWVFQPELHRFLWNTIELSMNNYEKGILYFDVEDYRDIVEDVRAGVVVEKEGILNHYYDMQINGLVDKLPQSLLSSVTQ